MNKPTEKQIEAFILAKEHADRALHGFHNLGRHFILEGTKEVWFMATDDYEVGHAAMMAAQERLRVSRALSAALAVEAGTEPRAWFVKDYADGWIYFDNEVDAQAYRAMSGSALLVAFSPDALTTSPASSDDGRCPRPCNDRPADFSMRACIEAGECGCIAFPASSAVEGEAVRKLASHCQSLIDVIDNVQHLCGAPVDDEDMQMVRHIERDAAAVLAASPAPQTEGRE